MLTVNMILVLTAFLGVACLVILLGLIFGPREDRVHARVSSVTDPADTRRKANPAQAPLPRLGNVLLPEDESKLSRLKARMRQAGLYQRHSTGVYLGVKFLLMGSPMVVGLLMSSLGMLTLVQGVLLGAVVGLLGNLAPAMWLGRLKSKRQKNIRRAMPDALDVIVVCLEGGLSLPGAFDRVATELEEAHPLLSSEMAIVRREVQLGRSTGDALRQFADRFDVEELRSLASVVIQAERFGASVVKALRVHAESLRMRRYQNAEAMAQKAPVKLIFPTVLCIFPALYIVLMGPAGVQLLEMLDNLGG